MQINTPEANELPDKLYFKVGEVSMLTGVPAYVLRFWETEFSRIRPTRSPSGQRLYRKCDVELILKIKYLLWEKKFTIAGARKQLIATGDHRRNTPRAACSDTLEEIRDELRQLRDLLS